MAMFPRLTVRIASTKIRATDPERFFKCLCSKGFKPVSRGVWKPVQDASSMESSLR